MKRRLALCAAIVLAAGVAMLGVAKFRAQAALPPVQAESRDQLDAWAMAAQGAGGQRVAVLRRKRGVAPTGTIYESGRSPDGWRLFDASPPGADRWRSSLDALAHRAAQTWNDESRACAPEVESALDLFAVRVVVVERGGTERPLMTSRLQAEPVVRVVGALPAEGSAEASDPVAFTKSVAPAEQLFLDASLAELWGGELTVQAKEPGTFAFPFPAEGASVTVDGVSVPAVPAGRASPLVVLDLAAGSPRVVIARSDDVSAWLPVAGAAACAVGLLLLLFAIRPAVPDAEEPDTAAA